jgi:hypothetical protein
MRLPAQRWWWFGQPFFGPQAGNVAITGTLSLSKVCRQSDKYAGTISRRTFPMSWLMSGIAQ